MAGRSVVVYEQTDQKEEVVGKVIDRIRWDAQGRNPILILFFSTNLRFYYYASRLNEEFKDSTVVGAVTDTIICSDGLGENGLSAIAIFEGIECYAGMIHDISRYPMQYADDVKENAAKLSSYENSICIEFTTALVKAEEIIMDTLNEGLSGTNIPIVGSSTAASDGNIMTYVSLNGQVYSEGCVYILIHNLNGRIGMFKENMYKPTGFEFRVTDVDCDDRLIYELDNRPASYFLSDKLNIKRDMLLPYMQKHPMGRYVNDDLYITLADSVENNGAISCYARIYNRTKLVLMELENLNDVWNRTEQKVKSEFGNISFSLLVNCSSRTKLFREENILSDFQQKLTYAYGGYIGVCGMGEQFDGIHTNQTMVLIVFE